LPQDVAGGDTLIVWKLDRLARSSRDLISMLDDFHQRGIHTLKEKVPFIVEDDSLKTGFLRGLQVKQMVEVNLAVRPTSAEPRSGCPIYGRFESR
jgi:hypothetical protein